MPEPCRNTGGRQPRILFWIGFVFGILFNFALMNPADGILAYINSVGLWFLIVSPLLFGTGFRAGMDVARRSREIRAVIAGYLDVDLFHLWVAQRPEWPLSTGLATRFSLYILLPILPIVGSYLFEKLADQFVTGGPV